MKRIKHLCRTLVGEDGFALPVALVLLVLGTFFVIPSLKLMSTNLTVNRSIDEADSRSYAADAGIEYAVWCLQHDDEFTLPEEGEEKAFPGFPDVALNGAAVAVTIRNDSGEYKVRSTATGTDGGSTAVECHIAVADVPSGVFDYALASLDGDIDLGGSSEVYAESAVLEGDIYANGDIHLSGSSQVDGDASATGEITTSGSSHIDGVQTEGAEPLDAPTVDTAVYKTEAQTVSCPATVASGDWSPAPGTYLDPPRVQRDLKISGSGTWVFGGPMCIGRDLCISGSVNVTFSGPVKVDRDIDISGSGDVAFQSTVYVSRDLKTSGSKSMYYDGTVYVCGKIDMTGSAVRKGQTIIAEGNVKMSGSQDLVPVEDIPFVISTGGDISFSGSNRVSAVVYAMNGDVTLSGSNKLYGCAVGRNISISGSVEVEYPLSLREREELHGGSTAGPFLTILTYTYQ